VCVLPDSGDPQDSIRFCKDMGPDVQAADKRRMHAFFAERYQTTSTDTGYTPTSGHDGA
jgi:hypothetical protein